MGKMLPPNGLPISCRERASLPAKMRTILAREAVSCMGMFGGASTRTCHSMGGTYSPRWVCSACIGVAIATATR